MLSWTPTHRRTRLEGTVGVIRSVRDLLGLGASGPQVGPAGGKDTQVWIKVKRPERMGTGRWDSGGSWLECKEGAGGRKQ